MILKSCKFFTISIFLLIVSINLYSAGNRANAKVKNTGATANIVYSSSGEVIDVQKLISLISQEDLEVDDSNLNMTIKISKDHINRYPWNFSRFKNSCAFTSDEFAYEAYGPFPDVDEAFRKKHLLFEMQLCVRKIFGLSEPEILYSTEYAKMEYEIISHAKSCGYDKPPVFEQFARVFSYLGKENLNNIDYFICEKK